MKTLKLLNKIYLTIFIIVFSSSLSYAEEELVDIWDIEKQNNNQEIIKTEENKYDGDLEDDIQIDLNKSLEEITRSELFIDETLLAGIYDPDENGLKINMWSNSDGKEISSMMKRIFKIKLSDDAKSILDIALLTNSYFPKKNITKDDFLNYKLDYLIKNSNLNLIKTYLLKNSKNQNNDKVIKYYVNYYLKNSDIENACDIFNKLNYFEDSYLIKFKVYCLINKNKKEEAQLYFDLAKEQNFNDDFFEKIFYFLMGYTSENKKEISDKNILDFHLSHRTNLDFNFKPKKDTPKIIWQYLSSSNLLQAIDMVDLENEEEILIIENATHDKIYKEEELFNLYKRFQFNINQLITVKDTYKLLPNFKGRALLYQRLLLTKEPRLILDLSSKLKKSFIDDNIENAFDIELSKFLNQINPENVPSDYSTFYQDNLISKNTKKTKIKINNKVIHQSKLLNYFQDKYQIKKVEKDLNDILKNIKKNKKYIVTIQDLMLLESLQSDGIKISKKYKNLFKFNQSDIPTDIQLYINNDEIGLVLLRLVEIIGEDDLKNIGPETLYFITTVLNQLNIDTIRNNILIKVLPLKV